MSTTIELSFGSGSGKGAGAWDDRELIKASEAAMKEFHIHHPGPGSWLDKATAALAAGRKLPGAEDYGTAWYSASLPSEAEASTSLAAPAPTASTSHNAGQTQNNKKRKSRQSNGKESSYTQPDHGTSSTPNPYSPSAPTHMQTQNKSNSNSKKQRFASPSYQPPSPGSERNDENEEVEGVASNEDEDDEDEDEDYDEQAEWGEADWEVEDYYPDQSEGVEDDEGYNQYQSHQDGPGYYGGGGGEEMYGGPAGNYGANHNQMPWAPSVGMSIQQQQHQSAVGREAALSYAMTAQYWAGYWMGVAQGGRGPPRQQQQKQQGSSRGGGNALTGQTRGKGRRTEGRVGRSKGRGAGSTAVNPSPSAPMKISRNQDGQNSAIPHNADQSNGEKDLSNVFVTQKRFNRPAIDGLRR
ncbi:hypothetical protein IAU59_004776 [Kwoniella sp. CBS 9459]